jgi:hypothetical protein
MTPAQLSDANRNPVDIWTGPVILIMALIVLTGLGLWMLGDILVRKI